MLGDVSRKSPGVFPLSVHLSCQDSGTAQDHFAECISEVVKLRSTWAIWHFKTLGRLHFLVSFHNTWLSKISAKKAVSVSDASVALGFLDFWLGN